MKKGLISGLVIFVAVMMSLFIFPAKQTVSAVEEEQEVASTYLVDTNEEGEIVPYSSRVTAGYTTGYGDEFETGATNVSLSTTAETGFKFVGWQIQFEDGTSEFITSTTSFTLTDPDTPEGEDAQTMQITFTVANEDSNADGYADKSTLTISRIGEDYKIEPVFDYIYYNLDLSDVFSIITGYSQTEIGGLTVYYTQQVENTYQNSIVLLNGKYYYFDEILEIEGELYTQHEKMTWEGGEYQNIPISTGAFRRLDSFTLSLQFNVTNDYSTSVNIDVQSVGVEIDGALQTLNSTIYRANDNRSTGISTNINISSLADISNANSNDLKFVVGYHNLYYVEVLPYVDNTQVLPNGEGVEDGTIQDGILYSSSIYQMILQNVVGNYAFYSFATLDSTNRPIYTQSFWVKSGEDSNNVFSITYQQTISVTYNYISYNYYNFANISTNNFEEIDQNMQVRLDYTSVGYSVNFVPAVLLDGRNTATVVSGLETQNSFSLTRGTSREVRAENNPNNYGYIFYCFSTSLSSTAWEENDGIIVSVNQTRPENQTVYVIYKYVNYTITVSGLNSISVEFNSNTTYPVNRVAISNGSQTVTNMASSFVEGDNHFYTTFSLTFNITQSFSLSAITNNGFAVGGFSIGATTIDLDEEVEIADIVQYLDMDSSEIVLTIVEEFVEYSFTYQINSSVADESGATAILADISLIIDEQTIYITSNITSIQAWGRTLGVQIVNDEDVNQIIISGLHLYDLVTLNAIGRTIGGEDADAIYQFTRFAYAQSVNLSASEQDGLYSANLNIRENSTVTAHYSIPTATLAISVNIENALTFSSLTLRDNAGTTYPVPADGVLQGLSTSNTYTLSFASALTGYTFEGINTNTSHSTSSTTITFTLTGAATTSYYIELLFSEIEYFVRVQQSGGGVDGEFVTFGEHDYVIMTISSHTLEFVMPNGYWVSSIGVVGTSGSVISVEGLTTNQTNDYQSTIFSHPLPVFANLITNYLNTDSGQNVLTLNVQYDIHIYNVSVNFAISNAKGNEFDSRVTFPSLSLTYQDQDGQVVLNGSYATNLVVFNSIPYNTEVTISVTSTNPDTGTSFLGFANADGIMFDDAQITLTTTIESNSTYIYYLEYIYYSIRIEKTGPSDANLAQAGDPVVYVNSQVSNQVSMFDSISVTANAQKTYGYTFERIFYTGYARYVYNPSTWESDWANLYYLENGQYLSANGTYDSTKTYYYISTLSYTDSSTWTDSSFSPLNYQIVDGEIVISVEYDYLAIAISKNEDLLGQSANRTRTFYLDENSGTFLTYYENGSDTPYYITEGYGLYYGLGSNRHYLVLEEAIKNQIEYVYDDNDEITSAYITVSGQRYPVDDWTGSFAYDGEGNIVYSYYEDYFYTLSNVGDLINEHAIPLENFATSYIIVTSYDGNSTTYEEEEYSNIILNYRDNVQIFINFNSITIDDITTNLNSGIAVLNINILGTTYMVMTNTNGADAYLSFNVLDLLTKLSDDDTIYFTINYSVQQRTITLKTNIDDVDFYNLGADFNLNINEISGGFGSRDISLAGSWYGGDIQIQSYMQFLAKSTLNYTLGYNYQDRCLVYMVRATIGSQVIDNIDQLRDYGIYVYLNEDGTVSYVECRYLHNAIIEFVVQPKFSFNNYDPNYEDSYHYSSVYQFQVSGGQIVSSAQTGSDLITYGINSTYDIEGARYFADRIQIKYYIDGVEYTPRDVGVYTVRVTFTQEGDWLDDMVLESPIYYEITPAQITLQYDSTETYSKQYDQTPNIDAELVMDKIKLYANGIDVTDFFNYATGTRAYYARITSTNALDGSEATVYYASENFYNFTLYRINLTGNYLSNFELASDSFTIKNIVKINPKQLTLNGLSILDKVYDGTTDATLANTSNLNLVGVLAGDLVDVMYNNIEARFATSQVGRNINVNIDLTGLITGLSSTNYVLTDYNDITATIYPYSVSLEIENYGTVTVYNERGKTDSSLVSLLPIGVSLTVELVENESSEFSRIYSFLTGFLSNTNVYGVGYRLKLSNNVGGTTFTTDIDNRLYVSLPNVDNLRSALYLTEYNQAGEVSYLSDGQSVIIDLSQMPSVNLLILTQNRIMFTWWQILLIVLAVLLIIGIILTIYFVQRYKKLKQYKTREKI